MKIFETAMYEWWQIGLLKLAVLAIGIVIGSHWSEIFAPFKVWMIIFGTVLGLTLKIFLLRHNKSI